MILNTKNENFKKYWLASVQPLLEIQKWHTDVLLTKKFQKLSNILKFESKVRRKGLKVILKTKNENF